jgi:hypothetical protein
VALLLILLGLALPRLVGARRRQAEMKNPG